MTASPDSRRWISLGLLFDGQVPDDDPEYRLQMYGTPGRSVGTGGPGDPEDFGDEEESEEDGW